MDKIIISIPVTICEEGFVDVKLLELILYSLDGEAFNKVVNSIGINDIAVFCKYLPQEQIDYLLKPFSDRGQNLIMEHMMFMGPVLWEDYVATVRRMLPKALMAVKNEGISFDKCSLACSMMEFLDPKIDESEIVFREWIAEQANLMIQEYKEFTNADVELHLHNSVIDKERLYSSGCIIPNPGCKDEEIPDRGYKDIKVGLANTQKGYLEIKMISMLFILMDDIHFYRVLTDCLEDLNVVYPYFDEYVKDLIEQNVAKKETEQLQQLISEDYTDQVMNSAVSILKFIEKKSLCGDIDIKPFDSMISHFCKLYSENSVTLLDPDYDPCKSMTAAVESYLHIF